MYVHVDIQCIHVHTYTHTHMRTISRLRHQHEDTNMNTHTFMHAMHTRSYIHTFIHVHAYRKRHQHHHRHPRSVTRTPPPAAAPPPRSATTAPATVVAPSPCHNPGSACRALRSGVRGKFSHALVVRSHRPCAARPPLRPSLPARCHPKLANAGAMSRHWAANSLYACSLWSPLASLCAGPVGGGRGGGGVQHAWSCWVSWRCRRAGVPRCSRTRYQHAWRKSVYYIACVAQAYTWRIVNCIYIYIYIYMRGARLYIASHAWRKPMHGE